MIMWTRPSELSDGHGDASGPLVSAVDYPLYVVTAGAGDDVSGCLAGFITQSSIKPAQFLICVSKLNHTFGTAQSSRGFGPPSPWLGPTGGRFPLR